MATPLSNRNANLSTLPNDTPLPDQAPLPYGLEFWDAEEGARPAETPPGDAAADLEQLAQELVELRQSNAQMREMLEEGAAQAEKYWQAEQGWAERQKEYEALLEEKSEVIRELHLRLQEGSGAAPARPSAAPTPKEEELMALSEEIERERCQMEQQKRDLADERRQLKDDEDALMEQMRAMELQMSRERADLARQRSELQRLHGEIRHEIELAQRDAALRERLMPFQRRQQELMTRGSGAPAAAPPSVAPQAAPPPQHPANGQDGRSGLFRKMFG